MTDTVGTESDRKSDTETPEASYADDFYISEIPDDIFAKMQGKSYKEDCTVPREDLRYVHVRHMGFDGEAKDGELVVNKAIADDVLAIFEELRKSALWMNTMRMTKLR